MYNLLQKIDFFAYNCIMLLYGIKYLSILTMDGEMSTRELASKAGRSISNASHAMKILHSLNLVKHPEGRVRYWIANIQHPLVLEIEKLLLISKGDKNIEHLLWTSSIIHVGSTIYKNPQGITLSDLLITTGLSRMSILKSLEKMEALKLIRKKRGKPNIYYPYNSPLAKLFFKICDDIKDIFLYPGKEEKKHISPQDIINEIKNDENVLILIHYGSSSMGKTDKLSDIDLFVVTRDKQSRGEIISKYSLGNIDLGVYSKMGFLHLIKKQPDFIASIAKANILKGKEILEAIIS